MVISKLTGRGCALSMASKTVTKRRIAENIFRFIFQKKRRERRSRKLRTPIMTQTPKVRILNCGDTAVTVEFGKIISPDIGKAVKNLDTVIKNSRKRGISETVPTFCSLTVIYEPEILPYKKLIKFIGTALAESEKITGSKNEKIIHLIPVCYDGEFAEDLADVAKIN